MSYRDDLAAAQARADAAMRELSEEREGRADDMERVAALELALSESLRELGQLRERFGSTEPEPSAPTHHIEPPAPSSRARTKPATSSSGSGMLLALSLGLCVVVVAFFTATATHEDEEELAEKEVDFAAHAVKSEPEPITEFDVSAGIKDAHALAREFFGSKIIGEPYLVGISAAAVDDQGMAHLKYGETKYKFAARLPELSSPPEPERSGPVGTNPAPEQPEPDGRPCFVQITMDTEGMHSPITGILTPSLEFMAMRDKLGGNCERPPLPPRCSVATIRERAIAAGAPADALAHVYLQEEGKWLVQIIDRGELLFDQTVPDDCASPQSEF